MIKFKIMFLPSQLIFLCQQQDYDGPYCVAGTQRISTTSGFSTSRCTSRILEFKTLGVDNPPEVKGCPPGGEGVCHCSAEGATHCLVGASGWRQLVYRVCGPTAGVFLHSHSAPSEEMVWQCLSPELFLRPKAEFVSVKAGMKPCQPAPSHSGFRLPQGAVNTVTAKRLWWEKKTDLWLLTQY